MSTFPNDPTAPTVSCRDVWLERDGARLYAVELGGGPPVVFLHGGLADHRAALHRVRPLAAANLLLCPDLRGAGRSLYDGALSWDLLADDVAAWLEHLGAARAIVGGTSMGAGVALRFALRHPRALRGLILMSPLYPGADRPLAPAAAAAMQTMAAAGQRALEHGVDALRPLFHALPSPVREVALEMMHGFDPGSVAATTRWLASGAQPMGSASDLAAIDAPVLLLPGIDPEHPPDVAALYAAHLRYRTLIEPTAPDVMAQLARFCVDPSSPAASCAR